MIRQTILTAVTWIVVLVMWAYIGVSLVGSGQKANGKIRLKVIMLAYTIVFADLLDSVLLNSTHKDTVLI